MTNHYSPTRMAKMLIIPRANKDEEKLDFINIAGGNAK